VSRWRPLDGQRVVVTRAKEQSGRLVEQLENLGAAVVLAPAIAIEDPGSWDEADRAAGLLKRGAYAWVIFASANAARRFAGRLGLLDALRGANVAAVGPATAAAIRERGIVPDLVPEIHAAEDLAAAIGPGTGRVLWPRAQVAPRAPVDALRRLGWRVDEAAVYRTVRAAEDSPGMVAVRSGEFDIITFASASAVRNVSRLARPDALKLTPSDDGSRKVACIGPSSAGQAETLGYRVDAVASRHSDDGLVEALVQLCGTMAT
jgi:uroporphyrinogen III methyltransferase / synthase